MAAVDSVDFKTMNHDRREFLKLAGASIAVSQFGARASRGSELSIGDDLSSLRHATAWLNSEPPTRQGLRGKAVLVNFWTYSCINWRRTLPYLRGWAHKYKEYGLTLIGVHTPEFSFEKNIDNVREAVKAMQIDYPVAMDNDRYIWSAFNNQYWPAVYLLDANSHVRAYKFGEGEYDRLERSIQQTLSKNGAEGFDRGLVPADATGAEATADWRDLESQENYLGYERAQSFASPGGLRQRKCSRYTFPAKLRLNHWAASGDWTAQKEALVSTEAHARLAYQFHARDLHLVMGADTRGAAVRFRLSLDGRAPGSAHGVDVDEEGCGLVTRPRMYQLVRQSKPIVDRRIEIEFLDPGASVFSFTFG